MITCTNVRRLHGLLAGFNVYSEPSWPCLTFNRQQKYFPPGVERRSCSQGGEDRDRGGSRFDLPRLRQRQARGRDKLETKTS